MDWLEPSTTLARFTVADFFSQMVSRFTELPAWGLGGLVILYRVRVEDEMLIESFGAEYAEYRRQVGALLPRLTVFPNQSRADS